MTHCLKEPGDDALRSLYARKMAIAAAPVKIILQGTLCDAEGHCKPCGFSILLARRLSSAYLKGINSRERNAP